MPALRNIRHEGFAQLLARGLSAASAYAEVGYKPNRHNASGLSRQQSVVDRVNELVTRKITHEEVSTQQALERAGVTKLMIVEELKLIAFARPDDFFVIDADGQPELDLNNCPRDKLAAIKSINIKEYYDQKRDQTVRESRVEFHDKKGSLVDLARMHGMLNDRANAAPTLIQINLTEAELRG